MLAASRGVTESVQLLLDAGANPDLQNQVLKYLAEKYIALKFISFSVKCTFLIQYA